ncbi:MAG: hypothetical protein M1821_001543 [Bathelium mastoideum]|nr:MAG: hypothetical protein M1821_001543 [Bathelium mastoideum]
MGDVAESVASAVVVPDSAETSYVVNSTATNGFKRRKSSVSSNASKRPRLSIGAIANPIEPSHDEPLGETRRGEQISERAEERKRGQRLFGGLLSTLSQSSRSGPGAATREKRKAEIEKKQAEKLKLRDQEYDEQKKRELDELIGVRRREQWIWDGQSMRIRHSSILAAAQFLQTETEPKLYYRPWELQSGEEDRIERQITDAQSQINQELAEFDESQKKWLEKNQNKELKHANTDLADVNYKGLESSRIAENANQDTPVTVGAKPMPSDATTTPTNNDTVNVPSAETVDQELEGQDEASNAAELKEKEKEPPQEEDGKDITEENVDHVVDAGEDAVIY